MFGKNTTEVESDSPSYDPRSGDTLITLSTGGILMFLTMAGMLAIAGTGLGGLVSTIYSIPVVGVVIFGLILSVGRHLGLKGVKKDQDVLAVVGAILLVFGYAWFGGGILHPYEQSLYLPAIAITGMITTLITLCAGGYVYFSNRDLSHWSKYSGIAFIGVIVSALIGSFFAPFTLLAFGLAIIGFTCDLVYEVWMTSNSNRSPYANGIALYVAFAGVFVHVLQLVLRMLAQD